MQPEVAAVVQRLLETTTPPRPDHGYAAFRRLFAMPVLEQEPDLAPALAAPALQHRLAHPCPGLHAYTRERTQPVPEALAELLAAVDLSALGRRSRRLQELLARDVLPHIPLPHLVLRGADRLSDAAILAALQ